TAADRAHPGRSGRGSGPRSCGPSWASRGRSARWPRPSARGSVYLTECSSALALPVVLDVALERPRRRELTELVADHVLRDEHRHVLAAVVDRERVADEIGDDGRSAGPGL